MDEAELARNHEHWLKEGRELLHMRLQFITLRQRWRNGENGELSITRNVLMLLALEPHLLEFVRQALQALPDGSLGKLVFDLRPMYNDCHCRYPPTDEVLRATATHLAHMVSSIDSFRRLGLYYSTEFIASSVIAACSRLEHMAFDSCSLVAENVPTLFSIKTLRKLGLFNRVLSNCESMDAFCVGVESSSLEYLLMQNVCFTVDPEQEVQKATQLAATLARSKTLVDFSFTYETSTSFCDDYFVALSTNYDTRLERLCLYRRWPDRDLSYNGIPGYQGHARGFDEALAARIRNMLKWNVQRKTCPPLFAAIENAETDAERKQCLVKAFEAVDIPVLFECMTTNQGNMITLVQRLGRSRKRQREP